MKSPRSIRRAAVVTAVVGLVAGCLDVDDREGDAAGDADTTSVFPGAMAGVGAVSVGTGATAGAGAAEDGDAPVGMGGAPGRVAAGGAGGEGGAVLVETCPFEAPHVLGEDVGQLLFDVGAPCDQIGKALFVLGDRLYWQYQRGGISVLARGAKRGGAAQVVVESPEPIRVFDVRGVVTYAVGQKVYVLSPADVPIELEGTPTCVALSSTSESVYCRTADGGLCSWPATGGSATCTEPEFLSEDLSAPGGARDLIADTKLGELVFDRYDTCATCAVSPDLPFSSPQPYFAFSEMLLNTQLESRISETTAEVILHTLRLAPGDFRAYWMTHPEPGSYEIASVHTDREHRTRPEVEVTGFEADVPPVFAPLFLNGTIIATSLADGSAAVRSSIPYMLFDYRSKDGVVAVATEPGSVYWLDRKGRIYRGVPAWPDVDYSVTFSSSVDDKPIRDLTAPEVQAYCADVVTYADNAAMTPGRIASRCIEQPGPTLEECSAQVASCVEQDEATHVFPDYLTQEDCVGAIELYGSFCDMTVKEYSLAMIARIDFDRRTFAAATCEQHLAGVVVEPTPGEARAIAAFDGRCTQR